MAFDCLSLFQMVICAAELGFEVSIDLSYVLILSK